MHISIIFYLLSVLMPIKLKHACLFFYLHRWHLPEQNLLKWPLFNIKSSEFYPFLKPLLKNNFHDDSQPALVCAPTVLHNRYINLSYYNVGTALNIYRSETIFSYIISRRSAVQHLLDQFCSLLFFLLQPAVILNLLPASVRRQTSWLRCRQDFVTHYCINVVFF